MTWIRKHARLVVFAALVAVQLAAVATVTAREEYYRRTGEEIVLRSEPVDPRDLLRGDYVILGYAMQTIPVSGSPIRVNWWGQEGDDVYVVLEQRGRYWEPVEVRRSNESRSSRAKGTVILKGRIDSGFESQRGRGDLFRISYPSLERYYIPQGTGAPDTPPDVVVSVQGDGTARIKRLELAEARWP